MKKQFKLMILVVLLVGSLFAAVLAPTLVTTVPQIWTLIAVNDYQSLTNYLRSFDAAGVVVLFALQFLQSLAPVFPQTILQVVAGATYGLATGTLILTTSYLLGNLTIFLLLRRFRPAAINKILNWVPLAKFTGYFQSKNPELMVFIFYLLPFLSNALVPYLAYNTSIRLKNYAFALVVATLPSMVVSVYLGDRLVAGDWPAALGALAMAMVVSIAAFLLKDKILQWVRRRGHAGA